MTVALALSTGWCGANRRGCRHCGQGLVRSSLPDEGDAMNGTTLEFRVERVFQRIGVEA
jgi:hypothetical protein